MFFLIYDKNMHKKIIFLILLSLLSISNSFGNTLYMESNTMKISEIYQSDSLDSCIEHNIDECNMKEMSMDSCQKCSSCVSTSANILDIEIVIKSLKNASLQILLENKISKLPSQIFRPPMFNI